jgi:hypothetical protein
MTENSGKYFFIPDWLLKESSQTIHAYIYILNQINSNGGEIKLSIEKISKTLNITTRNARTILKKISYSSIETTSKATSKLTRTSTSNNSLISIDFKGIITNEKIQKSIETTSKETSKSTTKPPIKQRKETFVEDLKNFANLYDKNMLNDFYRYWAETDQNEQKMRFEFQKTWNLNLRLITWQRNALKNFNKNQITKPTEQKIGRTSIETIKKNNEYNGQY